jgi:hypothetical protein
MRLLAIVGLALFLSACGEGWTPIETVGTITDISFQEAHDVKKVKRSPKRVPDTWYLNVKTKYGVDWTSITHAPWDWQHVGACVNVLAWVGIETKRLHAVSIQSACNQQS